MDGRASELIDAMNKTTKGALAAGAALVLLAGGAGSLAYWNDTASVPGGTITSGSLRLDDVATGTWTDGSGATVDPASFRIVPGDTLTYTTSATVEATGDNLRADLVATSGSLTGALGSALALTTTATSGGTTLPTNGDAVAVTSANDGDQIDVEVTVDFPFGTAVDNTSQAQSVDLSDLQLSLTQTDNPDA